jgi:trimethylamine--corrinoid protein Co-methyltransferase
MARYRTAFYQPMLSDWQNHDAWESAGARDTTQRATDLWQQLLAAYEEPAMEPAVSEELEAYVARRREEIERDGLGSE